MQVQSARHEIRDYQGVAARNLVQAGAYASVLHYLKAVQQFNDAKDGKKVIDAMKAIATDDPLFGRGRGRADGRAIHDLYLFQVKAPAESKGPYDFYKLVGSVPAEHAFRPMDAGNCPLVGSK